MTRIKKFPLTTTFCAVINLLKICPGGGKKNVSRSPTVHKTKRKTETENRVGLIKNQKPCRPNQRVHQHDIVQVHVLVFEAILKFAGSRFETRSSLLQSFCSSIVVYFLDILLFSFKISPRQLRLQNFFACIRVGLTSFPRPQDIFQAELQLYMSVTKLHVGPTCLQIRFVKAIRRPAN